MGNGYQLYCLLLAFNLGRNYLIQSTKCLLNKVIFECQSYLCYLIQVEKVSTLGLEHGSELLVEFLVKDAGGWKDGGVARMITNGNEGGS